MRGSSFNVWLYVGCVLGLYGVLLSAAGIYQWLHPPATVLAGHHATFWAGAILLLIGGTYVGLYWPRKGRLTATDSTKGDQRDHESS